ncbi:MAG: ABC transporter permease [Aristaeellaceae bacterium]
MREKENRILTWLKGARRNTTFIGIVLVLLLGTLVNGGVFLSMNNITNVGRQATLRGILACGIALPIICGEIDLSISTLFPLCGLTCLYFSNTSTLLAFLMPLLLAAAVGTFNGLLITKAKLHPWIATIAVQLGLNGVNLMITQGNTYKPANMSAGLSAFGKFSLFGMIDIELICFVVVFVVFAYLMRSRTSFRAMYAVGASEEAATMMGINVTRTRMQAHILCSMLAGLAGIILVARSGAGQATSGSGYEMYAIASCVIGGIHLAGGRGKITGAFWGAWILAFLNNIFNMQKYLNPIWYQVVVGLLVIVVVFSQAVSNEFRERKVKSA